MHPVGQHGPVRDRGFPQAVRSGVDQFEQRQELGVDQERQRGGKIGAQVLPEPQAGAVRQAKGHDVLGDDHPAQQPARARDSSW